MKRKITNSIPNMKKSVCTLFFLALCFGKALIAQEPIVKWGEPVTSTSNAIKKESILKTGEEGFYILSYVPNDIRSGYILDKYDMDFKIRTSTDILQTEGVMGDALHYTKIIPFKDKVGVIYTGYKKSTGESYCQIRDVGKEGKMDREGVIIERITAEKAINPGSFDITVSPDYSKMLIVTTYSYAKGQNAKLRLKVLDAKDRNELWRKEIELDFDSKKGGIERYLVDNEGNAYIAVKSSLPGGKQQYDIYTYRKSDSQWDRLKPDMGQKWFGKQNHMDFNSQGDVVFISFLSDAVVQYYDAISYVRINGKTQKAEANNLVGLTGGEEDKYEGIGLNWVIKGIASQSNGTVLIITEDEIVNRSSVPSQPAPEYIYKYKTKDIRVFDLLPDGTKAWSTTLHKNQECTVKNSNERWDSFVYTVVADKLYILYNNSEVARVWHAKNKSAQVPYLFKEFATNTQLPVFLHIIEPDGSVTYTAKEGIPLFNFQKDIFYEMALFPSIFYPLEDGIIVMDENPSFRKHQFGKIFFK